MEKTTLQQNKLQNPNYWKKVVVLFFLGWMAIYLNRTSLTASLTSIEGEFGLSTSQLGLLNSVFFFAYTFVQIPSGILGDKIGRKLVLVPGLIIFATGEFFTGVTYTFWALLLSRFATGFGEGTYYSPQYAISSEIVPSKYRSISSAFINAGTSVGMAIGLIGTSFLCSTLNLNWRVPIFITSVVIFLLALIFNKVIENDSKLKKSQEKKSTITLKGVKELLSNKRFLVASIVNFASCFGFYLMLSWLPYYLATERGLAGTSSGIVSSIVAFSSLPGALLLSHLSDKIGSRKKLALVLLPLAAIALSIMVLIQDNTTLIMSLIVYGIVGKVTLDPIMIAFVADSTPKESYSTTFGIFNFFGMLSSIVAPTIAGIASEITGTMQSVFFLSSILLVIGAISLFFIKEIRIGHVK